MISYNVYWIAVIVRFGLMRFKETKGHLPFMKAKGGSEVGSVSGESGSASLEKEEVKTSATVAPLEREIS